MQGADKYYNIIDKADRYKVGELKRIPCPGYGYGFQRDNIVFIISEHARGKTFTIWIYENSDIKNAVKQDHLEVYGVTGGQLGWTETYGWVEDGVWVSKIEGIFTYLEQAIYNKEHEAEIENNKYKDELNKRHSLKVQKYNKIFSDMNLT